MTGDELRVVLSRGFERWAACAEEARELDAALGDGDLGITVAAAARSGQDALANLAAGATPNQVLLALGPAIARSNPSTFAALAAAGLLAAAKSLLGVEDASRADLLRAARTAAETIAARGKSAVGDKTVLDALVPSVDEAEAAVAAGGDGPAALAAATSAARQGVAATAGLVSQRGRAAWIGERGRDHPDAGATVYLRFLEALSSPTGPGRRELSQRMASAEDLFAKGSPEVRAIGLRLADVVRATLPDALEMVDLPDRLLAFGTGGRLRDLVVGIIPHAAHVNVQFADGIELPDPLGLLEGTGKRARHVKNRSVADAERSGLRDLIVAAWSFHGSRG